MSWLLVRSHRGALLALVAYAIGAVVVAARAHGHEVSAIAACRSQLALCRAATGDLADQLSILGPVIVLPALIGTFLGAPLVARELESGTYRLAWTQGITRRRWLTLQLSFLVAVTVVVVAVVTGAATWADHVGKSTSFDHFDSNGIVPVGYALFALTLGVAIGVTTRRTVLAMGVTGAVFIAVRIGVLVARPNFLAPVTLIYGSTGPPPGSPSRYDGLTLSQGYVTRTGAHIPFPTDAGTVACLQQQTHSFDSCGLRLFETFQPADRYWLFQSIEFGIFVALAAAAAGVTLLVLRRR